MQAPLAATTPIGRPPGTATLHNPWGTPLATTTTTGRQLRGTTTLAALAGATRSNYDHRATTLDHHLLDNPWQALLATTTTTGRPPWTMTFRATFGGHPWQQLQQLGDHLGLRPLGHLWQAPRAATTTTYYYLSRKPWHAAPTTHTTTGPAPWTTTSSATLGTALNNHDHWATTVHYSQASLGRHHWQRQQQQQQPLGDHLGLRPLG